jgi:UDP-3-O-[3-hydroxymyristoyl] glucosamine N-acyltransferase
VGGHLTIGDDSVLMAQAGVFYDVPPKSVYSGGIPAFDHKESLRTMAAIRKLTEMQRTIRTLEKRLKEMEQNFATPGSESA